MHPTIEHIRRAAPAEGLFDGKEWLVSPEPFAVSDAFADELEKLGYRLLLFLRACNQLYFQSAKGKQPRWIAELLDRGKPPELVALSRQNREALPEVLRPDLILTEGPANGEKSGGNDFSFVISELDNVPGGIGLTGWLGETYAGLGRDILGGATGMVDGFRAITPGGADIVVSEESATYRPEMRWLAARLNERFGGAGSAAEPPGESPSPSPRWRVLETIPDDPAFPWQPTVYRFFELFDLPNLPAATALLSRDEPFVTPPPKPFLEEKLWFALFWLRPLREFWRRELSERQFLALQKVIPYTWLVDPAPLPPHAVLPGLETQSWEEVAAFSQKERALVLKISGFSELAWGSRGVHIAADLPQAEWRTALETALASHATHPYVLQRFHKGRLVQQPFWENRPPADGQPAVMQGRVRLCPYYFLTGGKTKLGGALATVCPADKKILHGMKDAILVPTAVA